MKYRELINFEPITSVVKLVESDTDGAAERLVKSFVFSKKIKEDLYEAVIKNLNPDPHGETKGIQIVGSYGTGKSHLMAVVAAIAEDEKRIHFLSDPEMKAVFADMAGHYKVLRFEIGTDKPLKDILFAQLERFLAKEKVVFQFDEDSSFSWKEQIGDMMSAFEAVYPDKHLLVVIDEMLEYLKGRDPTALNKDLMLLRQVGEACDNNRFKLMFGVQELLYRAPEFQFAAEMLNKVEDRYNELIITKEDVAYVVKERLLQKNEHQKAQIRDHLLVFAPLFDGINTNLNEYVDLFPVHPSYIGHFERIKHGKSQREILKVLSARFSSLMDTEVPTTSPGLITYDSYWEDLAATPSMTTIPDIRTVKEKLDIVYERIDSHFVQGRASRKNLARQIVNALAIRILSDDLDKRNGATAGNLKEDLCQTIPGADDPELLTQAIESVANQLKTATAGQYIDQDADSGQFYLRTEGGINIQQIIYDYVDTVLKRDKEKADQYWFEFLQYVLGLQQNTYRTGFKIWQHSLEWIDKRSFRLGYIFFGNPNERSTTEPIQQYYLFFCPLFSDISRNDEADEVYFEMKGFSNDFKERILLYGAAKALEANASSDQKALFRSQIEEHRKRAIELFDKEYVERTKVLYKSNETLLKTYQLPGDGAGKETIFSAVSAKILNKQFSDKFPDYPAFTNLLSPLSKENFDQRIRSALKKIIGFSQPNRDGEAILAGLGLINGAAIDTRNSRYADSIRKMLQAKGSGKVLNRDEILYPHYIPQNLWYSKDFKLDHQLEFVVLAAMVYKGDIEILWSTAKTLTASNIEQDLLRLEDEDYSSFQSIREPVGLPIKEIKALFGHLGLPDLSAELEKADTLARILTEAQKRAERVARIKSILSKGIYCRNVPLLEAHETDRISAELEKLVTVLDGIQAYDTFGKLKSFRYSVDELEQAFKAYNECDRLEKIMERSNRFESLVGYLSTAISYVVASESPLYDDMERAIASLPSVLQSGKESDYIKYETLLNSLVDRYADYYLKQYLKCRLSHADALQKDALLTSKTKQVCDIIKDVEFISRTEYENWVNRINSLNEADHSLTKEKVKQQPYHNFNPREFYDKPNYSIRDLKEQLEAILEKWIGAMRAIFKDPSVKANLDILDEVSRALVEGFRDGRIELEPDNAVKLRKYLSDLSKGFEKVELGVPALAKVFHKPMTIDEAREAFETFLDEASSGKERSKVRIVFTVGHNE